MTSSRGKRSHRTLGGAKGTYWRVTRSLSDRTPGDDIDWAERTRGENPPHEDMRCLHIYTHSLLEEIRKTGAFIAYDGRRSADRHEDSCLNAQFRTAS